ncbi:unnamed protein product [Dovyalis caffra]|uniref:Uncharacterized protein n=1 Tax=Dovyalis caffra TaxID=77055 RepID=A0AAV1RX71_9ROSI|nr:unnamed protein product [Dovyalis caffra]
MDSWKIIRELVIESDSNERIKAVEVKELELKVKEKEVEAKEEAIEECFKDLEGRQGVFVEKAQVISMKEEEL